MKILLTGASGFVGKELSKHLIGKQHQVFALTRSDPSSPWYWNPEQGRIPTEKLEGLDAIIHLSGENIAQGRWSAAKKERILKSRTLSTSLLAQTIQNLSTPPAVFLSTSACGIYGPNIRNPIDESAIAGKGFLAEVCVAWESAAAASSLKHTRVVHPRLGIVLGPQGGMLEKIVPIFRLGLGAPLGDGEQWMSWISLADTIAAFEFCLHSASLEGPVNFVSPEPIQNINFTKMLAQALHRPSFGRVPRFVIELVFGEMGKETALASSRVLPKKLLQAGFRFQQKDLAAYLNDCFK